ncbi:MAG: Gfo/Idh/MocA family oxidoreductase [Defluviitaleaceae bacterium]|nr:Gfo/Idh/MocA family oxidoreductase [Defluviitaleaceae bacterium]
MTTPKSRLVNTVLVGAGGFGANHGKMLLDNVVPDVRLAAIVDPYAQDSHIYNLFKNTVPVYNRLEDFYAAGKTAELVLVSSPHFLHYQHCTAALAGGSHVLCEKPLVPDLETLNRLDENVTASGNTLSVGFQWCCSSVMRGIKARIIAGEFGKPVLFKSFTTWPRYWKYYRRNNWAGRITMDDGQLVNDSVASNATSHHLQNTLFLLGNTMEDSANMKNVYAETYRANDIESFDTCVLRGEVGGAKVFYAASHATNFWLHSPVMRYELEKAVITVSVFDKEGVCTVHHRDGRVEELGPAIGNGMVNSLTFAAQAARGDGDAVCTVRTVRPFATLIDAIFGQAVIHNFPESHVRVSTDEERTYVPYLHIDLAECFNQARLPSEMGHAWSKEPTLLNL